MKSAAVEEFQARVSEILIRHRSILDTLSKLQESSAKVNRAVTKTVTLCGCISIQAEKQQLPGDISLKECLSYVSSHLQGKLCENCREIIEEKIGSHLFYLAALCHLLDLSLEDVLTMELQKIKALGYFNLS